ncbi:MAG: phosphodiester glycosidase family protein [Fidelibacterota bacterium]
MKLKKYCSYLPFVVLLLVSCSTRELTSEYRAENIHEHITWHVIKTDEILGVPSSINILDIDLNSFEGDIAVAWYSDTLVRTSDMAKERDALAAVNGSFFDMRVGGAVVFLQEKGMRIAENHDKHSFSNSGAYALDTNGVVTILKRPPSGWTHLPAYEDVMASGPLMIYRNAFCELDSISFNLRRHPRTAVGITEQNHLLLLTVDGRSPHAAGMSMWELREYMDDLNCRDALNLDGGGSTTMYIRGKKADGVVNYPSDNGKFDHGGERRVANALVILE